MPQFDCPACNKTLRAPDSAAGKKVKCPCGKVISLPASVLPSSAAKSVKAGGILECVCGKKLRVPADAVGKMVKCSCGLKQVVPAAPASVSVSGKEVAQPAVALDNFDAADLSQPDWLSDIPDTPQAPTYTSAPAGAYSQAAATAPPPYSGAQQSSASSSNKYLDQAARDLAAEKSMGEAESSWSFDGGTMLSGIGMMVGAAVWFFVGLYAGYIFFYPPILFIIGLVTFVKGIFD